MNLLERANAMCAAAVRQVPDALLAGGAAAVAYGTWLVYPPAGFIAGGVQALAFGWLLSTRGAE